ncbi:MAG: hypothetical protein IKA02_02480, partial [Clostridia bacterium]|nr:hypothetical protein [Clostridia bacterium]
MSREKANPYDFSEEAIKRRRTFPKKSTWLIIGLSIVIAICVLVIIFYDPSPRDRIDNYEIFIEPQENGTLNIEYKIKWSPLDTRGPLTWVYIGVANPNYSVIEYSDNIKSIEKYTDDNGQCHMDVYFKKSYYAFDTFEFSIKINQGSVLCEQNGQKFYEFVPCWFNLVPVDNYSFYWKNSDSVSYSNSATEKDGYLVWSGSMEEGEYRLLRVNYKEFNAPTTFYQEFDDSGVGSALDEDRLTIILVLLVVICFCVIAIAHSIDCFVSYYRGRGFFRGYGHHMYVYGRRNKYYEEEASKHVSSHG